MMSTLIQEKMAGWAMERDEIQKRIAALHGEKREAAAAAQAALKAKDTDGIIAARQVEAQLDQEIEALKMIAAEIAKAPPVDHDTFQEEYAEFNAQQMQALDKWHNNIKDRLQALEDSYYNYEQACQHYIAQLRPWQKLAEEIGIRKPCESWSQVLNPAHRDVKKAVSRLRMTGGI